MRHLYLVVLFLLFISITSSGHSPRIVGKGITVIEKPEVSQAFYGELDGSPDYFQIESDKPFLLYVSILVPAIEDVQKDKSVEVTRDGVLILELDAPESDWEYYYEEFGGDGYYEGPEAERNVTAGTYLIKVHSPQNRGKYTLAVGKREEFSFSDALLLPRLKSEFFGKSPLEALFGIVGMFFVLLAFLAACIVYLVFRFVLKKA